MKIIIASLFLAAGLVTHAHAQETPTRVYYIGFNDLLDNDANARSVFTEYIDDIVPIMARYGLTLETYDVVHSRSSDIQADAITFGTAPDQEHFAAFFADPDFQAAFPRLVSIIENHVVVFTSAAIDPAESSGRDMLLSLHWLKQDKGDSLAAMRELHETLSEAKQRFGKTDDGEATGLMANRGLAGEITTVAAPTVITLGGFRDAHGYFDDPAVRAAHDKAKRYIEDSSAFWLKPWK